MKSFKTLFGMMFVALMAASCTNDVNDVLAPEAPQKGYPFEATIAPKTFDATTRTALVEDTENCTISSTWQEGDMIRIDYMKSATAGTSVDAMVTKVATDGSATIKATFIDEPYTGVENNADLSYPAGAVHITNQDGTLSADRDLRYGPAKLKVDNGKITFDGMPSLDAEGSIIKFTMKDLGETPNAISVSKLVISSKDYWGEGDELTIKVTPTEATDVLYVTIPVQDIGSEHTFWFEATASDGTPYIAKATGTLELGMYYQTTLKMATVGNVIGSDGKFYKDADAAGTAAEAMIAYLGNEATDAPHGLAIALEMASKVSVSWDNSGENNGGKTAAEIVDAWANFHEINGDATGWRLPSAYDWQRMFIGCGSTSTYVESLTSNNSGMNFSNGNNFISLWNAATGSEFQSDDYWSSTEYGANLAWVVILDSSTATVYVHGKGNDDRVLACLAF